LKRHRRKNVQVTLQHQPVQQNSDLRATISLQAMALIRIACLLGSVVLGQQLLSEDGVGDFKGGSFLEKDAIEVEKAAFTLGVDAALNRLVEKLEATAIITLLGGDSRICSLCSKMVTEEPAKTATCMASKNAASRSCVNVDSPTQIYSMDSSPFSLPTLNKLISLPISWQTVVIALALSLTVLVLLHVLLLVAVQIVYTCCNRCRLRDYKKKWLLQAFWLMFPAVVFCSHDTEIPPACTASCSNEYVNGCMGYWMGPSPGALGQQLSRPDAYAACRNGVDSSQDNLVNQGCVAYCTATEQMLEASTDANVAALTTEFVVHMTPGSYGTEVYWCVESKCSN
jgi:hypothetical protein